MNFGKIIENGKINQSLIIKLYLLILLIRVFVEIALIINNL